MQEPKLHPELQMQQMLQVDLLLRPANSTSLVATWHGAPSQVNIWVRMVHLNSPPQKFTKQQANIILIDTKSWQTPPEGNSTHLKHQPFQFVKLIIKRSSLVFQPTVFGYAMVVSKINEAFLHLKRIKQVSTKVPFLSSLTKH